MDAKTKEGFLNVGAIAFVAIGLIAIGQYLDPKIALGLAAIIFFTALMWNNDKLKEVFK